MSTQPVTETTVKAAIEAAVPILLPVVLAAAPKTFGGNLRAMWGHISTYVVLLSTGAGAAWLQLGPAKQQAIIDALPGMQYVAPLITIAAFVLAKGIVQKPPGDTS